MKEIFSGVKVEEINTKILNMEVLLFGTNLVAYRTKEFFSKLPNQSGFLFSEYPHLSIYHDNNGKAHFYPSVLYLSTDWTLVEASETFVEKIKNTLKQFEKSYYKKAIEAEIKEIKKQIKVLKVSCDYIKKAKPTEGTNSLLELFKVQEEVLNQQIEEKKKELI